MSAALAVAFGGGVLLVVAAYFALAADRPPREPLLPLAVAIATGGMLGPALAAAAGATRLRGAALVGLVPLALALLTLFLTRAAIGPLDGTLLGAAGGAAAGTAAGLMIVRAGAAPQPADALAVLLAGAGALAALGAGVGRARLDARPAAAAGWLALGAAVGAATLAPWLLRPETWGRPAATALVVARFAGPPLVVLGAALLAARFERRVFERELGEEVGNGILPGEVALVVASYRRRLRSSWWPRGDERRALVALLRRLAFRKQQLRGLHGDRLHLAGLEVGRMRDRVRRLFDPREVEALAREFVG